MLTLEERERRAYIEGRTGEAALLAHCLEGDGDLAADVQHAEEAAKESEKEADQLRDELQTADDRIAALESELDQAHEIARAALVGEHA